jgi:hypothetical protein
LLAASTSSSVFSYGSLVVFGIFVFKAFLFAAGGWSDLCVSADDLFLLDAAPAGADEAAAVVVGIGGGSGAGGACCCGGDSTAGGVGFLRGGDATTGGGDAAFSCTSSSSCPTSLWSCSEWTDGLRWGEALDLKKTNKVYVYMTKCNLIQYIIIEKAVASTIIRTC